MTGTNLAVGKRARQSSTYDWRYQAGNAVFGNYSTYSMTDYGYGYGGIWWLVDLEKNAVINKVNYLSDINGEFIQSTCYTYDEVIR